MPDRAYELSGVRVLECGAEGAELRNNAAAVQLVGAAFEHGARCVVIPAARLGDEFFRLRTGLAGDFVQKFVTYGIRLAIMGDISRYVVESRALRDFVREINRGDQVWFVPTIAELSERLAHDRRNRRNRP